MPLINTTLLKRQDEKHATALLKHQKTAKFPKKVTTVHQKNVHITEKILRPYFTLASDLFKEDGHFKKTARTTSAQYISNRVRKRQADSKLFRRVLRKLDIGKMFTFMYSPKAKRTLEYYDRIPVVIPLIMHTDGFTGLNMHMIEPKLRITLLNQFKRLKNLTDLKTFMRLTYKLISKDSTYRFARPMIRRYLYTHMQSLIITIPESDWEIMQILPSLNFAKKKDSSVWLENKIKALRG